MDATARLRMIIVIAGAAALLGAAPNPAAAQAADTVLPVYRQQMVTANPFGLMFEWFNAEYERAWRSDATWGVNGSFFALDSADADYATVGAFCRYYPQGRALGGFFVGGRAGLYRVSAGREAAGFGGVGFEVGYTWLLGRHRHFAVSIGAGATRLFGGALDGVSLTVPTVRLLNLGVAF
jgi:hypothetical protein